MTATSVAPTTAMAAKALCLVADQSSWSRGKSRADGTEFWVIPGSTPGTAHYTTAYGCTCKSFERRGVCSHMEAVKVFEAVEDERLGIASVVEVEAAVLEMVSCRSCGERTRGERYCSPCRRRLLQLDDD